MAFVVANKSAAAAVPVDKTDNEKEKVIVGGNLFNLSNKLKSYDLCENRNEWWKNTIIYEVYVRSFYDSNSDGIGDLNGVKEKLDYFVSLGVNTLWLTPFYPSPMVDFGYDISNFLDVDPVYGNLDDFKTLLRDMKNKDLKLILDFVPNHTSDQHEWFQKSIKKEHPFSDYYVWKSVTERDSDGEPIPPNNWISVFGGSSWTYHPLREEFYLHQFTKEQPDLNFRNVQLTTEMKNILEFWLELGVDGFRLDAAPHLLEDPLFRDNPRNSSAIENTSTEITEENYEYWSHEFTTDVPGNLDIIEQFREVCDSWTTKTGQQRILLTEGYLDVKSLMNYYGTEGGRQIAHFSFNFQLLNINSQSNALDIFNLVSTWFDNLPKNCWANWQIGNHDQSRAGSRCGEDAIDMLNMINLLLPGTAITYYGEEIGMLNTDIKWEETVDPAGRNQGPVKYKLYSRDPERTPMQWSNSNNAGFSSGTSTWLPLNPNYTNINVKTELHAEKSHLKVFKVLSNARKLDAWKYGTLELGTLNNLVFAFTRVDINKSKSGLLVVTNFGYKSVTIDATCFSHVPSTLTLLTRSLSSLTHFLKSDVVDSKNIQINGRTGAVFKFTLT